MNPPTSRLGALAEALSSRPLLLTSVCLLANALFMPYMGIVHDAQLYSGQTLNRIDPGCLDNDLFFRYGSQDRYSVFSLIAAPLAKQTGIPVAFFAIYVASMSLYVYAGVRLSLALFAGHGGWAAGAAVLFAITNPAYGGFGVFHVPEAFTTPRIAACAFSLWGLERMLARKAWQALPLLILGMAFHPLMAVGPLAMACGFFILDRGGWRIGVVVFLLAVAALATVIWVEPLGLKVFGHMGADWKADVRRASLYNFVDAWPRMDWVNLALAGGTLGLSWALWPDAWLRKMFAAILAVAVVGMATFALAPKLPYALLFQGQGYRAVWVVHVLQAPLTLGLAAILWPRGPWARTLAVLLGIITGQCLYPAPNILPTQAFILVCGTLVFWLLAKGHIANALWPALLASEIVARVIADISLQLALPRLLADWAEPLAGHQKVMAHFMLWSLTTRLIFILMALLIIARILRSVPWLSTAGITTLALVVFTCWGAVQHSPWYRKHHYPLQPDLELIREVLDNEQFPKRSTIYWCGQASLWHIWGEVRCRSYYHPSQVAGSIFDSRTAAEGTIRADRVRPFAVDRLRKFDPSLRGTDFILQKSQFHTNLKDSPPTVEDLIFLAHDTELAMIILPIDIDGMAVASNGRIWIYDARAIRGEKRRR